MVRTRQKITTFLWFDDRAEEAARFYVSLFDGSRIVDVTRYGDVGPGPNGAVMTVTFELSGQQFIALNAGPLFEFNEAISLFVDCDSQAEIDQLWTKLTADGGKPSRCGWLKDKFGLSWQIVPGVLLEMQRDEDAMRVKRVMEAMLGMVKLDIAGLRRAYEGH